MSRSKSSSETRRDHAALDDVYEIYAQLAKKLFDEAISVSLVNETSFDTYSEHVKNYAMHPLVYHLMTKDLAVE